MARCRQAATRGALVNLSQMCSQSARMHTLHSAIGASCALPKGRPSHTCAPGVPARNAARERLPAERTSAAAPKAGGLPLSAVALWTGSGGSRQNFFVLYLQGHDCTKEQASTTNTPIPLLLCSQQPHRSRGRGGCCGKAAEALPPHSASSTSSTGTATCGDAGGEQQ